ncbi:hypothetical protein Cyast_0726 [Cyanobacterium stanieri PCC 7202]|uniref:Uncharacterized protein n=1 Tax=Cyanobacterium stanieri (strain ATCC 29140 / PCC 7202) TaxID=292563 RepID=K9YIP0_CYASC|nr:hypothetical protein Cyast_0726 [Cyanobacterium stanieri PCC 7202]
MIIRYFINYKYFNKLLSKQQTINVSKQLIKIAFSDHEI